MPLTKLGSCNNCGKCCMPPVMSENPCIDRGQDRCKFYVDQLNTYQYGHCLIYGRGNKPIASVKDSKGSKITQAQIDWFNQNCLYFPKDKDAGKFKLPSECGFSFEAMIDG